MTVRIEDRKWKIEVKDLAPFFSISHLPSSVLLL
jgi:hypothetical protein